MYIYANVPWHAHSVPSGCMHSASCHCVPVEWPTALRCAAWNSCTAVPGKPVRIERLLANLGYGKRRECQAMAKAGAVLTREGARLKVRWTHAHAHAHGMPHQGRPQGPAAGRRKAGALSACCPQPTAAPSVSCSAGCAAAMRVWQSGACTAAWRGCGMACAGGRQGAARGRGLF